MKSKECRIVAMFMAMLVVSMFAVAPAMACAPQEQVSKEEESKIVNEILPYTTTKEGKEILSKIDFEVDWSKAVLVKQGSGYLLTVITEKSTSISDVKGVSLFYDGSKVTDVFLVESREITNGIAVTSQSLINENDGTEAIIVKDNIGKAKLYVQDMSTNEITTLDISCEDICKGVVSVGCTVGGYLLCTGVCGPAAPACAIICGIIYGLVCTYGQGTDCDYLCTLV
ncbi:hypothetical protein HNV12_13525 [Methanococcoides sp. SA1]|nr:hypothetical protein [Methanococcoides sp. SA1]